MKWTVAIVASLAAAWLTVATTRASEADGPSVDGKPNASEPRVKTLDDLRNYARDRAARPFVPTPPLPDAFADLSYDEFRHIAFRHEKAVWHMRRPFWLEFFHRGFVHKDRVAVSVVGDHGAASVPFSPKLFEYRGDLADLSVPDDLGFAGFRVAGRFPGDDDPQEMLTFLGASYFRIRTAETVYGCSARGLAVDIGLPRDEEFPAFHEFWVTEPKPGDTTLSVLALLDGPSVCGAYAFTFEPGRETTEMDVAATLYFRKQPETLGLAPLTGMWMWGDSVPPPAGDHRPEVHDADGLLLQTADGRWINRALGRLEYPSLVTLNHGPLKGFGLVQRDTDPDHYRDDEAKYARRPGVWVTPLEGFDAGSLRLLELDSENEGIDNIAAWWQPDQRVSAAEPMNLKYRLTFLKGDPPSHKTGKVVGWTIDRQSPERFVLDLEFADVRVGEDGPPLTADVQSIRAEVLNVEITGTGSTRKVRLTVKPTGEGPLELSVGLRRAKDSTSERWAILLPLNPPPTSLPPWRQMKDQESSK